MVHFLFLDFGAWCCKCVENTRYITSSHYVFPYDMRVASKNIRRRSKFEGVPRRRPPFFFARLISNREPYSPYPVTRTLWSVERSWSNAWIWLCYIAYTAHEIASWKRGVLTFLMLFLRIMNSMCRIRNVITSSPPTQSRDLHSIHSPSHAYIGSNMCASSRNITPPSHWLT